MAKKFLTDIDLSKNELQNAVVQPLAAAPSSPKEGQIYYNTGDSLLYQYDGTTWKAVGDISGAIVGVTESAGSGDTLKSYTITQGGATVGTINIPKDYLVKSAELKTVTTANQPYQGAQVGDKYIDFVLNTKDTTSGSGTDEHIYLPVNDLVDVYTAGNGINISSENAVSVKLKSSANGLSVNSSGLGLNLASPSTNGTGGSAGAMSAADKEKLNGISAGAEENQNAFSNVKVGSSTISAGSKTATLELVAGANITLTPDTTNRKVTISSTDTKLGKYAITNPALSPSYGICTWTISKSSFGDVSGSQVLCTVMDSSGNEVIADVTHTANSVVVKMNSSSNIAAGTYTALIIG